MNKLLVLATSFLLLFGCKHEAEFTDLRSNTELSFDMKIGSQLLAVANPSSGNSAFGLFMIPTSSTNFDQVLEKNKKYTYDINSFSISNPGSPIYYPQSGAVDLIAYAPYNDTLKSKDLPIDLSAQSDLSAIDFLYSNNARALSKSSTGVSLTMNHILSKLNFTINNLAGLSSSQVADLRITLKGFQTKATFDLGQGIIINPNTPTDLSLGVGRSGIVLPHLGTSGRSLELTLGNEVWTYTFPSTVDFGTGKEYNYTITIRAEAIEVSINSINPWVKHAKEAGSSNFPIEMIHVEPGTFRMGGLPSDGYSFPNERPQHWVKIPKGFYMSKYMITRQQYVDFLNSLPKNDLSLSGQNVYIRNQDQMTVICNLGLEGNRSINYTRDSDGKYIFTPKQGEENYPIVSIYFYGALRYAQWLGGTLPTEAQWEYACRAGTTTLWSFGDDPSRLSDYAVTNYTNVGTKLANPWGFKDMHGLCGELCFSAGTYPNQTTTETAAIEYTADESSNEMTVRGAYPSIDDGSVYELLYVRSAYRYKTLKSEIFNKTGFRVVVNY